MAVAMCDVEELIQDSAMHRWGETRGRSAVDELIGQVEYGINREFDSRSAVNHVKPSTQDVASVLIARLV